MPAPETEIARAEAALRASEALRAGILETALDAVVTIDHEGLVLDFNPAAVEMFGWARAEAVGREMAELIVPPELRERHRHGLRRAVDTGRDTILGRRVEITGMRRGGETFPCELAITRIPALAGQPRFTGHIRDITDRKRAEEDLRWLNAALTERVVKSSREAAASQELFYKAFHSNPAAMTLLRLADGRFVDVNASFVAGTEHTREQAIGRRPEELGVWIEGPAREEFYGAIKAHGAVRDMEITFLSATGRRDHVLLSGEVIDLEDGPHLLTVAIDINARRRAEAELRQALAQEKELSRLKSSFVTLVSHEFRTPLGIIMSAADILAAYFDRLTPEQRNDHLGHIHGATRRMADLMEEVLLLGRVEAGKLTCKPAPLQLGGWVRRLSEEMLSATSRKCQIACQIDPAADAEALADETLLRHIFTNLLSNGVKYSPAGSEVILSLTRAGDEALFAVQDAGIGIPAEDFAQLFEAFHRGRNVGETEGSGLGLTIVNRCVEIHGGTITVCSTVGTGTTVEVRLPLFAAPTARPAELAGGEQPEPLTASS